MRKLRQYTIEHQVAAAVCVASSVKSMTIDVREFIKRRYIARLLLVCWKQNMSIPSPIIPHGCSSGEMLPDLFIQPCCAMQLGFVISDVVFFSSCALVSFLLLFLGTYPSFSLDSLLGFSFGDTFL